MRAPVLIINRDDTYGCGMYPDCLRQLGHAYAAARDYARAVALMKEGESLFQTVDEPHHQTLPLIDMAFHRTMLNETDTGFRCLQQGLERARTYANRIGVAKAISLCGTHETLIRGNQLAAANHFQQARAFHLKNNNPSGVAVCEAMLGRISLLLSDLESAHFHLQTVREIVTEINDVDGTANALSLCGLGLLANL